MIEWVLVIEMYKASESIDMLSKESCLLAKSNIERVVDRWSPTICLNKKTGEVIK